MMSRYLFCLFLCFGFEEGGGRREKGEAGGRGKKGEERREERGEGGGRKGRNSPRNHPNTAPTHPLRSSFFSPLPLLPSQGLDLSFSLPLYQAQEGGVGLITGLIKSCKELLIPYTTPILTTFMEKLRAIDSTGYLIFFFFGGGAPEWGGEEREARDTRGRQEVKSRRGKTREEVGARKGGK
jgi:hypothetical protein